MTRIVHLGGEFLSDSEARVSVDDRGFLFGDGVYEAIRALDGVLFEGDAHLQRLHRGMAGLEFAPHTSTDAPLLLEISERLLTLNDLMDGHALVYLQVTRGVAARTHHFPVPSVPPTVFVSAARFVPPGELQENGAAAVTHTDQRWQRCDLKTVNLLPNVLAKQHAREAGATEALLVRDGVVTEGSHTNVFAVLDGELHTHPCTSGILHGITRAVVLRLARECGLVTVERPILASDLRRADEVFLTGTTTDVIPITRIDGQPVGSGRPGPTARLLLERYLETMRVSVSAPPIPARSS